MKSEKQLARITGSRIVDGMVVCDVQYMHQKGGDSGIAMSKPSAGVMWRPKTGWTVVVDYLRDGTPYVSDILSVPEYDGQQELPGGSLTIQFSENTHITVKQEGGSTSVDVSAESVSVDADDVSVDASNITLGTNGETLVTNVEAAETNTDGAITELNVETTSVTRAE